MRFGSADGISGPQAVQSALGMVLRCLHNQTSPLAIERLMAVNELSRQG